MKNYILTVLLFLVYSIGISQVSVVDYTIMGNESNEYATDVDTLEGFIYISGNTNECGNNNGFVLKYKNDSLYDRKLIGNYNVDIIESIESRADGKLFLAGYTDENNDYDVQLAKLDTQLNVLIEKIIEFPNWNFCYDISLNNNGVVGVGKTHNGVDYDAFVFKIDDNLDTVWTSVISKPNDQQLNKVISYNDSIYIAAGYSEIDVEGGEMGVLKGAINILKKWSPVVIFEHGMGASDYYGTTPEEMWEFLNENDYSIFSLRGFVANKTSLTIEQFINLFETNKEYYFIAKAKV